MKVNGKQQPLKDLKNPDLRSLLDLFDIKAATVAIEINGQVVSKQKWNEVKLNEEDHIEVIRFVGGG
ncbi:MAG: sulfur carrier protein ThiS [Leptonema sp. (in: Bacteria)]|nr:sulfur carrier protein ThiS [Leptonema sp. (in: bacteria)]